MDSLICISHLRWDFVWQRPQHLLSRLAKYYRIFFVEEPISRSQTEEKEPFLEISPAANAANITVVRLIQPLDKDSWMGHGDPRTQNSYARLLNEYLAEQGVQQPLVWLYTPMASDFLETLPQPRLVIYDVMDQLAAFKGAPPELLTREEELLKKADIVFTGGASLYRAKLPYNPATYLFPSGVEIEHFAQAADPTNYPRPVELAELFGPILGYYGVIDERMDLALLDYIARQRPDWNIVLVGPIAKIDKEDLPQAPNLHRVDMRGYNELPAYLAHFDVGLVPFALNEATRYLSPTKTLEYLAAYKPVVSTPIHDVIELYGEVVRVANNPAEFVSQVEAALHENKAAKRAATDAILKQGTWDNIAGRMHQIIEQKSGEAKQPKTSVAAS